MTNPLINSLASIIEQQPEDHALREHLAELLIAEGRGAEAVSHLAVVLAVTVLTAPAYFGNLTRVFHKPQTI